MVQLRIQFIYQSIGRVICGEINPETYMTIHISKIYSKNTYKTYCGLEIPENQIPVNGTWYGRSDWIQHKKPDNIVTSHTNASCLVCLNKYLDKKILEVSKIESYINSLEVKDV